MTMLARGFAVMGMSFVAAACSKEDQPLAAQEDHVAQDERIVRPMISIVPGGFIIRTGDGQEHLLKVDERRRFELELSESDRALLAEYSDLFEEKPATPAPEAGGTPAADATSGVPLLFGYETRDHELWMHHGTEESLYTVKARDGRVLASEIDGATLARDYPTLHALATGARDLIDVIDR